jgi:hypothetical protein
MLDVRHDLVAGDGIGSELVGDHHAWSLALLLQQFAHQPPCRLGIPAALHQNVEDEAVLVDRPPQPVSCASDGDDHLVEVPFVTQAAGSPSLDPLGDMATEFLRPCPYRLVRDDDAAGSQHVLDHAQAERKAEIQPHRMGDDLSRKSVAAVERITGNLRHARLIADIRQLLVNVTVPCCLGMGATTFGGTTHGLVCNLWADILTIRAPVTLQVELHTSQHNVKSDGDCDDFLAWPLLLI